MTAAAIQINGVTGSNTDLPINTVVALTNANNAGVTTWAWTIVDQPAGAADTLTGPATATPTLTPRKEGTYLLQLVVNATLPDQAVSDVVAAVRQLKTGARIPAAGETNEADANEGWHPAVSAQLQTLDALKSDPNLVVCSSAGTYARGNVVFFNSDVVIKAGLPGAETVPVATQALASVAADVAWDLGVVEATVRGGSFGAGVLIYVRRAGLFQNGVGAAPVVGQDVFVSDAGGLANATPGTNIRKVGVVVLAPGGNAMDVWLAGQNSQQAQQLIDNGGVTRARVWASGGISVGHNVDPGASGVCVKYQGGFAALDSDGATLRLFAAITAPGQFSVGNSACVMAITGVALSLDATSFGISVGGSTASKVDLCRTGSPTEVHGSLKIDQGFVGVTGVFGPGSIAACAILDLQSTTQVFVPPRMTLAQANAIAGLIAGAKTFITNGLKTTETAGNGTGVDATYSTAGPAGAGWYPAGLTATLVAS